MKILVPIKRVMDYNVKPRIKPDNSDIDLSNAKMSINPFCEIAVEEAVRLKETGQADEVIAISLGSKACQDQIRSAMALGADRGILVETEDRLEPLIVAKILNAVIEKENPNLVILGKQSIDADNNQTGQMLAALSGLPQGTFASSLSLKGECIEVTREVDSGTQTLSLKLPAIVTTDLRLNEPRYASLPNIMKAKKKPLEVITPTDLEVEVKRSQTVLNVSPPLERTAGVLVESVQELVDRLRNEARVI